MKCCKKSIRIVLVRVALLGEGHGKIESENRGREERATLSTDDHRTVKIRVMVPKD